MISPFRFINKFQIQFSYTQYISKLIIDYCHNQLPPSPSKKEKSFLSQNIKRLLKYEKCIIPKYISSAICNCIGWMGTSNNLSSNTGTCVVFSNVIQTRAQRLTRRWTSQYPNHYEQKNCMQTSSSIAVRSWLETFLTRSFLPQPPLPLLSI